VNNNVYTQEQAGDNTFVIIWATYDLWPWTPT
jgi:hypothetical protein